MAAMRGSRLPVGSSAWIAEERATAVQVVDSEIEEFTFSARNDFDWLNEHMAEIFNENEINVAEIFKTPGKLRGKTPRTARKANLAENRVPLSDIFSGTPNGAPNAFTQHLNRLQSPIPKTANPKSPASAVKHTSPNRPLPSPKRPILQPSVVPLADSGYHGSQSQDTMDMDDVVDQIQSPQSGRQMRVAIRSPDHVAFHAIKTHNEPQSPTRTKPIQTPEHTFHTAREEQTTRVMPDMTQKVMSPIAEAQNKKSPAKDAVRSPQASSLTHTSPTKYSPVKSSPFKPSPEKGPAITHKKATVVEPAVSHEHQDLEDMRSPSEGSSPIRPVVRKSSLNFASLPAREPLTTNKSLGGRISRTSHLDQNRRSYYGRATGGKSLGNNIHRDVEDDDHDDMDVDDMTVQAPNQETTEDLVAKHNKTYAQRLHDQINMLGKSQPNAPRPSKSVAGPQSLQANAPATQPAPEIKPESPKRKPVTVSTPGAFPTDDDDDDWIEPPAPEMTKDVFSPRPVLPKSYTADVMQGIHNKDTISGPEFVLPKQRQPEGRPASPARSQAPFIPERTTSTMGHHKSASVSVPVLPNFGLGPAAEDAATPRKGISVSNPTLASVSEMDRPDTPSKSPSRTFRDSPLKQVKNKLSSILKTSKGLLASSAAISAEGKSLLSPSTTRLGLYGGPSTESLAAPSTVAEHLYPDLSKQVTASDTQTISSSASPPRGRKTRASAEREKEAKRREKEAKLMNDQMDKLQKAREKESEKARVFSQEQERVAAMEKQIVAQKEHEKPQALSQKEPARPTRTSPRKAKAQQEAEAKAALATPASKKMVDEDVDMMDAPASMPPPPVPRSAGPNQASKAREIRRPVKPTKEAPSKAKAAPTVIRVNTGSQHSQYHPSNSVLSVNLNDTLGSAPAPPQLTSKASQASLKHKASAQSLKSSTSSSGRPKALELAAKRKEQEEREAQRKREAKAEIERKRAAAQEEERRQEQQRRLEADKQKEKEREQATLHAEAKKNAQKQAAIERAKQTRAPPPATRTHPNGPPDYSVMDEVVSQPASQRMEAGPPRPPSRLTSTQPRPQEEHGRPVNAVLSQASKAPSKRPLNQEAHEEVSRNPQARNGPTYQAKDAKRRRTSEGFEDELDMGSQSSNIKGPPVRPSGGFKKDLPTKSMFPTGYTNAPQTVTRDLFKATVAAQHNSHVKAAHPLDMAQLAKGAIPFAPNPNAAGAATHKTPARPMGLGATGKSAAKSAPRSSPRFQNGDQIELPEIQTDDEDEEDEDAHLAVAPWADSPDLRRALMQQERMDPSQIFGPPAPLVMEEVFSKNKDRWHKFRARTSSANWSGADRLTEDDIRKDLAARDKMRRDGGWSYEMSRDMV